MERLPSVEYEPIGEPSLFDLWERGMRAPLAPPVAVVDPEYRRLIVSVVDNAGAPGRRLVSVGAGNGFVEAELRDNGWDVLATDPASSARRCCRAKGLTTSSFTLLEDGSPGVFDVVYCDGVMGHVWTPSTGLRDAWRALASLGRSGSVAVVANDLSDHDVGPQFRVRSLQEARFYRPPAGTCADDARGTGWDVRSEAVYEYLRGGTPRRREIVVALLLVDERVEPEDGT